MGALVKTQAFRDLNIGVAFDEGLADPGEAYLAHYAGEY